MWEKREESMWKKGKKRWEKKRTEEKRKEKKKEQSRAEQDRIRKKRGRYGGWNKERKES